MLNSNSILLVTLLLTLCSSLSCIPTHTGTPLAFDTKSQELSERSDDLYFWRLPLPTVTNQTVANTTYVHATRDEWIRRLSPSKSIVPLAQQSVKQRTAQEKFEQLRAHPNYQKHYWLEEIEANPNATRVIWLIPQYHRSSEYPALWSSLGREIAEVQDHIDTIITQLHTHEGLDCVGVEGSSAKVLNRSRRLDQAARWAESLSHAFHNAHRVFSEQNSEVNAVMTRALTILEPYYIRFFQMLDGAGIAINRLLPQNISTATHNPNIRRFGLEDSKLNEQSVELLQAIRELEKELILEPSSGETDESSSEYALRMMWLSEYPEFAAQTLDPIEKSLEKLTQLTQELRREQITDEAEALQTFLRHFRLVYQQTLRPDDIKTYQAHYQSLTEQPNSTSKTTKDVPTLTPEQSAHNAAIQSKLTPLYSEYSLVAHQAREAHAIQRTLTALDASTHQACALVMGAGHLESLKAQLQATVPPDTAVLVVRPFAHAL